MNFFKGFGPDFFGPGGAPGISDLTSLGAISGYKGPLGPLTGVFLERAIPTGSPPDTIDFTGSGATDFEILTPLLGQVIYIGDGKTSGGVFQQFKAPPGATRLLLGIPDGFAFGRAPGAYDDNDGTYQVRIGVNEIPTVNDPDPVPGVPEGGSVISICEGARCCRRWCGPSRSAQARGRRRWSLSAPTHRILLGSVPTGFAASMASNIGAVRAQKSAMHPFGR